MTDDLSDCIVLEPGDKKPVGNNPKFVKVVCLWSSPSRVLELLSAHPAHGETKDFGELEVADGHDEMLAFDKSSAERSIEHRRMHANSL